jgi:uncharacterized protein (UPF0303 family)
MTTEKGLTILDQDLEILAQQEHLLRFPSFNAHTAWRLGSLLREALLARDAGGTVEIELAGHLLFACATPGATPGQANWIRRKRNTVHHFARSTYAIGRKLERDGGTLESRHALSETDYAAHGGGFPVTLEGTGMVGSIIFSGLPQREDHNLVVDALATLLGIDVPRLP